VSGEEVYRTAFGVVPVWVTASPHLTHADRSVYVALCQFADRNTDSPWPNLAYPFHRTIEARAHVSENTRKASLRRLRAMGAVKVVSQQNPMTGGWKANHYFVPLDPPDVCPICKDNSCRPSGTGFPTGWGST